MPFRTRDLQTNFDKELLTLGSINDIDDEEEDDDRVDHIAVKSPKSDKWKKFQPTKKKSSKRYI